MTYIYVNLRKFLKIPVASNTVNSLLLRRLGKTETEEFPHSPKVRKRLNLLFLVQNYNIT